MEASAASHFIAELVHVSKSYGVEGQADLKILEDVSLGVREGEFLALLGQSGSGKSTVLRCLTGLTPPSAGVVRCYAEPLQGVNPNASIVFQTFALYPWLTVEQNIAVGLMSKRMGSREKKAAVDRVIELIGLSHYHESYPREISGGMRQRVGIARALVSAPKILCLDEAFSALDVLTAENLRQELLGLWHQKDASLKSVFMVTHNIEEAVEMATRICVLFPRPGRVGLELENPLPYPRDPRDPEFQRLVAAIHEAITTCSLPESTEALHREGAGSRFHGRMESIPCVPVGQILGLLSIIRDTPHLSNMYEISDEVGKEFGETLALVKAAEILELVDTPRNDVLLTELGRRFLESDRLERKRLFSVQICKLRLFQLVVDHFKAEDSVDAAVILREIAAALPYENAGKVLQTMVAWGRYAGIMDHDRSTNTIFVPQRKGASPPVV
ncbi:MAG: hypothetical protein RLZZ399_577 [Verrucomicrobiota bacterium]|jgi:NitT/TauT family transport system ATP-binding protein